MASRSLAVLPLLLAGALSAQHVSPAYYDGVEGPGNNVFPFGSTVVPFRFAQIHDDIPTMVITGMQFRHNATATVAYPSYSVTVDGWVSTAITTSATADATFDNNHGLDKVQVITNRTYTLGPSNLGDMPGQWVLDLPFDIPFPFAGSGASLCWEVHVTAKTNTANVVYDAASGTTTNPTIQNTRFGNGCRASGRTTAMGAATTGTTISWTSGTGTMAVAGSNLLANGAVFFALGFDNVAWNGNPLPTVIPTSSLGSSGPCTLYINFVDAILQTASSTGAATLTIPHVPTPSWHGFKIYAQILGLDPAANAFGVTASNATVFQWVAPHGAMPVARIFLSGSLGPTGTASPSSYLVTRFY